MTAVVLRGDARHLPLPDERICAYLAGIIDADGCIRVGKTKPYTNRSTPSYHARVHVRQVERQAVDLLGETFGGHVWTQKPNANHGRSLNVWDISDAAAQRALVLLVPYLLIKLPQAENALALRALQAESRHHRTKVTGTKAMTGQYGQRIVTPITCLSDEYLARCEAFYLRSRELNRVGV